MTGTADQLAFAAVRLHKSAPDSILAQVKHQFAELAQNRGHEQAIAILGTALGQCDGNPAYSRAIAEVYLHERANKDFSGFLTKATEAPARPILLWMARHGKTALNGGEGMDRIRGWADVPLDPRGEKEAEDLADYFANKPLRAIHVSNLRRTITTAEAIARRHPGIEIVPTVSLRPWNVGDYTGQLSSMVHPELERYVREKPHEPLPGGESFHGFKERCLSFIQALLEESEEEEEPFLVVAHFRNLILAKSWIASGKQGHDEAASLDLPTFFDWKALPTGVVLRVDGNGDKWKSRPIQVTSKSLIPQQRSYFSDCPRDNEGHCKPHDADAARQGHQAQQPKEPESPIGPEGRRKPHVHSSNKPKAPRESESTEDQGAPATGGKKPAPDSLDSQGGQLPQIDPAQLRLADFITYADGVPGANCGNCRHNVELAGRHLCDFQGQSPSGEEIDLRGQPVNPRNCCFLPGDRVKAVGKFRVLSKAWYSGEAVEIRTSSGYCVALTVNHPVLADDGFTAAGALKEGDYLFCEHVKNKGIFPRCPEDKQNTPTLIEEIFDAWKIDPFAISHPVEVSRIDFHGDGEFIQGNVDIVSPRRLLRRTVHGQGPQGEKKLGFSFADFGQSSFSGERDLGSFFIGKWAVATDESCDRSCETRGFPCGVHGAPHFFDDAADIRRMARSGYRVHGSPFEPLRFSEGAKRDTVLHESCANCSVADAEVNGYAGHGLAAGIASNQFSVIHGLDGAVLAQLDNSCIFAGSSELDASCKKLLAYSVVAAARSSQVAKRFPGNVTLDKVIDIRRFHYHGPVYDAETSSGLIVADGILVSNCSMWDAPGTLRAWKREGQQKKGWDETKHPRGQPENAGEFASAPGGSAAEGTRPHPGPDRFPGAPGAESPKPDAGRTAPYAQQPTPSGSAQSGRKPPSSANRSPVHRALETERMTHAKDMSHGVNRTYLLDLEDGTKGVFKPASGESARAPEGIPPRSGFKREVASSRVADILGMADLVPETTFREQGDMGLGSMQKFSADSSEAAALSRGERYDGPEDAARAAAFDYLIWHMDRHQGNWLMKDDKLVLIDNGFSFPKGYARNNFHMEFWRNAVRSDLDVPDLSSWADKWEGIKKELKDCGIHAEAIDLAEERLLNLVQHSGRKFKDLSSPAGNYSMGDMVEDNESYYRFAHPSAKE